MGDSQLVRQAIAASGDNALLAIWATVRIVRWKMIIAGELEPFEGELLPIEVREEIKARGDV